MSSFVAVDIFVEDQAHAAFLIAMLKRIARKEHLAVSPQIRSARGGHGRVMDYLRLYQELVRKGAAGVDSDLLIVGIDCNCSAFTAARKNIQTVIKPPLTDRLILACPDPHVERWYLADPESFKTVVGHRPTVGKKKCGRDHYKRILAQAIKQAGHPPMLGGIEFASELVEKMNIYKAGKSDRSLKTFVDDLRSGLRNLPKQRRIECEDPKLSQRGSTT